MSVAAATGPRWAILALGALCVAAGAAGSAFFLPRQSLWNDEATQLAGLTLDPIGQARWLAGVDDHDFGVPDDRMPPISYWAGWAWSRAFGRGEAAMRWMGLVATAAATALVFAAGRRAWGAPAGAASALLFGLSPNVVVMSVEIRAYPLFLATSAGLFYCLVRFLDDPAERQPRWLAGMTAFAVLGLFTHFFGLVAAGGAFLAALVLGPRRGGKVLPILVGCALVGLAAGGLVPFVAASAEMSKEKETVGGLKEVVRMFYRLLFHASMRVSPAAAAAAVAGAALAVAACLAPLARGRDVRRGLLIAWASGTLVVLAASNVAKFNTLATQYNAWMFPTTALILGSSLAADRAWARRLGGLGIAAVLAGMGCGDYVLATRGESFAHTGFALVDAAVREHGPGRTSLIYDEVGDPWHIYSPLRYTYRGELPQFILAGEEGGRVRLLDYPAKGRELDLSAAPGDYLVLVRWKMRSADEVVEQVNGGVREIGDGAAARALKASPDWELIEEGRTLAFVAAEIDVFRRKSASEGGR